MSNSVKISIGAQSTANSASQNEALLTPEMQKGTNGQESSDAETTKENEDTEVSNKAAPQETQVDIVVPQDNSGHSTDPVVLFISETSQQNVVAASTSESTQQQNTATTGGNPVIKAPTLLSILQQMQTWNDKWDDDFCMNNKNGNPKYEGEQHVIKQNLQNVSTVMSAFTDIWNDAETYINNIAGISTLECLRNPEETIGNTILTISDGVNWFKQVGFYISDAEVHALQLRDDIDDYMTPVAHHLGFHFDLQNWNWSDVGVTS